MSAPLLFAAGLTPWLLIALLSLWRLRGSRSLRDRNATVHPDAPLLTVIIPARDEERNIERCVASIRESSYPNLEIIIVDDHSADRTGEIARTHASADPRVTVTTPPPLPHGWFGKSWACFHGATLASGSYLLFTDADTWHHPELHARLVNALRDMNAGLLSIAGRQEVGTFWERLLQPLIFLLLVLRYGGTESVNRSASTRDKIANGQCILTTREAYDLTGGHAAVRSSVAEDLRLAQIYHEAGVRPMLELGIEYLSTRMYQSLGEVIRGWGKNIYAGSVATMPFGAFGRRVLAPIFLMLPSLLGTVLPVLFLYALAVGSPSAPLLAGATVGMLILTGGAYVAGGVTPLFALLLPIGSAILGWIIGGAILRGMHVSWKGRSYRAE